MTDGQSFLAFLSLLYLSESLVLWAPGVALLVPRGRAVHIRRPFLSLFGLGKELSIKGLWPGRAPGFVLEPLTCCDLRLTGPATLRRAIEIRLRLTLCQREWGALLAFIFFLAIPTAYLTPWRVPAILGLVLLSLGVMVGLTVRGFRSAKHLPFPPSESRAMECLSNILFPWHAMRSADKWLLGSTRQIHPICTLLAFELSDESKQLIGELYRRESSVSDCVTEKRIARLDRFLLSAGLVPEQLLAPPLQPSADAPCYCHFCHETFLQPLTHCPDCQAASIREF